MVQHIPVSTTSSHSLEQKMSTSTINTGIVNGAPPATVLNPLESMLTKVCSIVIYIVTWRSKVNVHYSIAIDNTHCIHVSSLE